MGRPQPEKLREDLADLRRGREVAGAAQRIPRDVVAELGVAEGERHVAGDADRALLGDQTPDQPSERRLAQAGNSARRAFHTSTIPTTTSGIESAIPVVIGPTTCPSGSRNSSARLRASP